MTSFLCQQSKCSSYRMDYIMKIQQRTNTFIYEQWALSSISICKIFSQLFLCVFWVKKIATKYTPFAPVRENSPHSWQTDRRTDSLTLALFQIGIYSTFKHLSKSLLIRSKYIYLKWTIILRSFLFWIFFSFQSVREIADLWSSVNLYFYFWIIILIIRSNYQSRFL